ncbi:MAG TPA: DNA polymerase III subunit alpha [Candidatus Saccharimonadales bacterium]|nr:DNA polymerase III subunit alpha [Candidatus Saccharimonadales bacterium]
MAEGNEVVPTASAGKLTPADYVHLHNHTQYSLLDGLTKVPALIQYVKDNGMSAVAQTDHGTLTGAIEFYKEATASGIKPIIGMETYVAARTIQDKEPGKDKAYYHLILLAMNNQGYQNLMKLSTIANLEGVYYKPRVDHILLEKYSEGLIVVSGCIGGELGDNIRQGQYDKAIEIAQWYKRIFGDRYYIEVQDHGHPDHPSKWDEQVKVNEQLLQLSKELDIPPVVTCDAHYLTHEDQTAHEILLCVQTGSFLSDEKRMSLKNFELHVTDPKELIKRWENFCPEAILNTKKIADRCDVSIELGKILIPKFPVPDGESEKSFLDKLVYKGVAERYLDILPEDAAKLSIDDVKTKLAAEKPEVLERTQYELGVIDGMGFNGYMLIVQDFINWGKAQGIIFGPGRGSAAGSIIAYTLYITDLDPLLYGLLFERFLNPDRISMPDIDVDIQDTRRDEVIQYCAEKYGHDRVSNIVTFGRMAARAAVRDVARVMQVPYAESDRLAKLIPQPVQGRHIPLKVSIEKDPDLKREYETNQTSKEVIDLAIALEGTIRSHGVHACGVVIAPDELVKFVPLEMAQKGVVAAQFPMGQIEELGLLKMDFLGLSNLTIIKNTLRIIKRVHDTDIDLGDIPLDDPETFALLGRGDTTGVFQFESAGMKRYLRELKPNEFSDVIAMGALYRPGPLSAGLTDSFIKRKNGLEKVEYAHPLMESALGTTYGVLVYQEQVMQISREVCGFTGGEADTLRKAIGKKKHDVMAKMQVKFIDGAIANGVPRQVIEKFWKDLLGFADYCFNKSHSACYGMTSYWTAYLKAHYPSAFMAALMTSDFDDTDRLSIEIGECQKMGIDVLPPDVNESFHEFGVVPDKNNPDNRKAPIRFGMDAIKNVGTGAVEEIIRARTENGGSFANLEEYLKLCSTKACNRKALESLVKAGAFDRFGDRSEYLHNMDVMLAFASRLQKEANSGQVDLFGTLDDAAPVARPQLTLEKAAVVYNSREQLLWERELLGLYLSQHPLSMFSTYLAEQTMPLAELKPEHDSKAVVVGGAITDMREITTKNGAKMAFVKLEDESGELELILFPNAYQQTTGLWERDRVILARGKLSAKDREGKIGEELKVMVDDAREITAEQAQAYTETGKRVKLPGQKRSAAAASPTKARIAASAAAAAQAANAQPRVYVRLQDAANHELLKSLKQTIDAHTGDTEVVLVLGPAESKQIIKLPARIQTNPDSIEKLRQLAGATNIKVQ